MSSADYDGIKLCEKCGEYTTGRLCRSCAEQEMIDNDPMTGYGVYGSEPGDGYYDDDYDDDDDEYPWGDDFDHDNGYYYDDEPITERLTLRGRWFVFRWFILPDFIARVKWRFWYSKMRLKSKIYRLTHRNPYDEIPF